MSAVPIGLVIFDCDGVLVDSEPLSIRILMRLLSECGVELSAEEASEAFLGKSLASVCESLRRDHGVDVDDLALERMRQRLYQTIRQELQPISGIADTLERLGRQACVASSSQPERIRLSLEVAGLSRFFGGNVFSATMVARGKPAPDLFLHAARQMHVAPGQCMVIEDSPAGVTAALEAGMGVCGFVGGSHARTAAHRQKLAALKPKAVFEDMRQLPGLLRDMEKDRKVS
ncbi:MAG: HAD family hydrolase [Kiloniellaceae bacterium]